MPSRHLASALRHSLCCVLVLVLPAFCSAGDWPQILGPNRDGRAVNEKPLAAWAASGPKQLWTYQVGQGFAGPAIVGDRVIVFHRSEDDERVEALDRATGKRVWRRDFAASYEGTYNPDAGPRCVPLVHGGRIYLFGAAGNLHCVSLEDGAHHWSRDTYSDYRGKEGFFGAGTTPIVADEKLIVNVGGAGAGLVAFDLETGKTIWKAADDDASYSSPAVGKIGDKNHVVFVTRLHTVSIDPRNGAERFRFPFGARGPTVNAATPLLWDNYLFVSASYNVGCQLWKIGDDSAKRVWGNDEVMSSQYTTCVYRDGYLYGSHGREDYRNGELRCIEAKTGKVRWSFADAGVAHTILVKDRLIVLSVDGTLRLAQATPESYKELAKAQVANDTTRALPAYSNGQLFFRTSRGSAGKLYCLQLTD